MKKAYVKVKPKSTKKSYGKAYIVAAIASALLCAVIFSSVLMPDKEIGEDIKIDITGVTPEEIAQVSEPLEIEVPVTTEIVKEPEREIEVPKEEPIKAEEAGIFNNADVKLMMPVSGEIISGYSGSKPVKSKTMGDWRVHSGIDIKADAGTKVKAPSDGKVVVAGNNKLTGNTVSIDHGNGFVSTIYNLESINVQQGDSVKEGDVIGTVGNSAPLESMDEPHAHFELKKDGLYVNPQEFIK